MSGRELAYVEIPEIVHTPGWARSKLVAGFDAEAGAWEPDSPVGKFLRAVRGGASRRHAAAYSSVSWDRVRHWLAEGARVWPDDEDDIDLLEMPAKAYALLLRETTRLEAVVGVEVSNAWRQAAMSDWRAAEKFMARRFPEEWAPRTQIDVSGRIDVDTDDLAEAIFGGNEEMRELLSKVEDALGVEAGEGSMTGSVPLEDIYDAELVDGI